MVIWVAVGGRGTLIGAIIGALLVNYAKTKFTAIMPDGWLFALGALFVLVTLYLPKGLVGLFEQIKEKRTLKNNLKNSSGGSNNTGAGTQEASS
jgi:urea transport system permease protein